MTVRLTFFDTPVRLGPTPKQRVAAAYATLQAAEAAYAPYSREVEIPGSAGEQLRKELEKAQDEYNGLRFVVEDSAPNISMTKRLKALNQFHNNFYRRRV